MMVEKNLGHMVFFSHLKVEGLSQIIGFPMKYTMYKTWGYNNSGYNTNNNSGYMMVI